MRKKSLFFVASLTLIISINSCLKYKELSDVNGFGLDVQGATPLFSYNLTIQDLFFKVIRSDSTSLSINSSNKIYQWTENISEVNAINIPSDSLHKNIPVGSFIGIDSISYKTTSEFAVPGADILKDVVTPFTQAPFTFTYPTKQGKMKNTATSINIIQLNKTSGKLKFKIKNTFIFPVKITIQFPELPSLLDITIDTLGRQSEKEDSIIITNLNWVGKTTNSINYNIIVTLINVDKKTTFYGDATSTNNLETGIVKIEETFSINSYDAIFGDVGSDRYLFTDSIRQKLNITDPFILDPNNDSRFPNIAIQIDYNNRTLGIDAKAILFDAKFKMKDGTEKPLLFFNQLTNKYEADSLLFPLGIERIGSFGGPAQKTVPGVILDTSNTNFQELNLNLRLVDTLLYKIKFYSLRNTSEDTNSFIVQPSTSFVNSASGKLTIPYVLSSIIYIDTSKTSVINIPDKFYTDINNIIEKKNGTGELQEIELTMTVENNTIFSIIPQVYFMNNSQTIDSFSNRQRIPPATLSPGGIVRLPNSLTITKKLTPAQWEQLKYCNRLTSSMLLATSTEEKHPSITTDMYVKFYFKIGNVSFKYLIKK